MSIEADVVKLLKNHQDNLDRVAYVLFQAIRVITNDHDENTSFVVDHEAKTITKQEVVNMTKH